MKRRNSHPHAPIQTLNKIIVKSFTFKPVYINLIQDSPFTHQTIHHISQNHLISKDSHFCFSDLLHPKSSSDRSYIMAGVQSSSFLISSSSSSTSFSQRKPIRATINFPRIGRRTNISLPTLQTKGLVEELGLKTTGFTPITENLRPTRTVDQVNSRPDPLVVAKLYAILEAVADRVEMHKNIGEQRDNWNSLLLTSINGIILAAAAMAGIAAAASGGGGGAEVALKLSSTLMYLGATGMLTIMNKIQPSQLVEEQRNATRLFKNLYNEIQTTLSIGLPTVSDVKDAMERVLALDRAFPLPLLGAMLEKFPDTVEPAVWWPEQRRRPARRIGGNNNNDWNGWNGKLEDDLKEITQVLRVKDKEDYLRLGQKALKINKILAISGPLLTSLGAVGSCLIGSSSWAAILGVTAGALASVVNTFQHGGQVGMVFEMYRCNAGFFQLIEQSIDSNLSEKDMDRRENGEVFEMKVALKLGRSLSELRDLAAKSSHKKQDIDEFGSKLF